MKCQKCGTEIGENDQFCYNCGHKISPEAALAVNALNLNKGSNSKDASDLNRVSDANTHPDVDRPDLDKQGSDSVDLDRNDKLDLDKPIKSRFASVSPDEFDSDLEKKDIDVPQSENFDSDLAENNLSEEDKINEALQKESGQLFSDPEDSNLNHDSDLDDGYYASPSDSNLELDSNSNLNNGEYSPQSNYSTKTKKNPMFLALVGILILGFASGAVILSNPGDLIPYIPLLQNQTNSSQNDSTVQPVQTEELHHQNKSSNTNSVCSLCGGKGSIACSVCGGSGFLTCSQCGGTGTVDGADCPSCGGAGKVICTTCQATGYMTCPDCGGSGRAA